MSPTIETVRQALAQIQIPGGGDLMSRDLVRALTVEGGQVRFVLEAADPDQARALEPATDRAPGTAVRWSRQAMCHGFARILHQPCRVQPVLPCSPVDHRMTGRFHPRLTGRRRRPVGPGVALAARTRDGGRGTIE